MNDQPPTSRVSDEHVDRRQFLRRTSSLGAAGVATAALGPLAAPVTAWAGHQAAVGAGAGAATTGGGAAIDVAEWSYFWVGVSRAKLARGTVVNGEQMYVEYWRPTAIRHPYPIVIVHGGGGQGLDWLARPDGGPGWVTYLIQEGYAVYLVDRPGHGRSPFHPELHGAFPERASAYAQVERQFTAPEKAPTPYGPFAKLHTQWPGTGVQGDPSVDQVIAGQGGSFVNDIAATHEHWGKLAGELLDRIGPAIVMAHSAGGPSCWIYANARPGLVKGLVAVEPGGPPFGNLRWGVTASRVEYDPPVSDPSQLQTVDVKPTEPNRDAYKLLATPRQLKHLAGVPIAVITAPASYHYPYDYATVAFLRQCGCTVEHIELEKLGVTGNAHFMMMERNNRDVLQPILRFLQSHVTDKAGRAARAPAAVPKRGDDSSALQLADHGFFWTGVERKTMPYGVIPAGQMYVQYLVPREVRHQTAVVLVHGGTGQMLHYMGVGGGVAGWAHYFAQAGYRVYLVDRPGHGRSVYHPDALGPIGPTPTYEQILPNFARAARGLNKRWPGTGALGDPTVDQFMASQNGMLQDYGAQLALWSKAAAALLDRIGPSAIVSHSAGGPFAWLAAEARPKLVRSAVCFEGAGAPMLPVPSAGFTSVRPLAGVAGIPMLYFTAEASGRTDGPAVVDALRQSGAAAEHLNLKDRGILGNGHFAMLETNRKQVFDVVRTWIESKA
jgi:pimeloyl-ACP methyl ester carboxylesterase